MEAVSMISVVGGLFVSVLVVGLTAFAVLRIFGGLGKANAERERLLREGIQAGARVMALQMGTMTMTVGVHRHLQLHLQLEIQMPGRPPYPAMLTTMVSELQIPQLQPGAQLAVRVDPRDGTKIALEGGGAPAIPAGAKLGLWIGLGGGALGVVVAIVVVLVNVMGVGLGSASEGDSVCARAVRCCEVAAAGKPSSANCKNMGKLGVPSSVCEQSLQTFREVAKSSGQTCH